MEMPTICGSGLLAGTSAGCGRTDLCELAAADWLGRVALCPSDMVVVDDDGAALIPQKLVEAVAAEAPEQERLEEWIMSEVDKGAALPGLYPPNAENKARYEAWRAESSRRIGRE